MSKIVFKQRTASILNDILDESLLRKKREVKILKNIRTLFRPESFELIMRMKGWNTNKEIADLFGCSEQYISMLRRGVCQVSTDFLNILMQITGNVNNFKVLDNFLIQVPRGEYNPNHQMWNQQKYNGERQYDKVTETMYAPAGEFRKQDADID